MEQRSMQREKWNKEACRERNGTKKHAEQEMEQRSMQREKWNKEACRERNGTKKHAEREMEQRSIQGSPLLPYVERNCVSFKLFGRIEHLTWIQNYEWSYVIVKKCIYSKYMKVFCNLIYSQALFRIILHIAHIFNEYHTPHISLMDIIHNTYLQWIAYTAHIFNGYHTQHISLMNIMHSIPISLMNIIHSTYLQWISYTAHIFNKYLQNNLLYLYL